MEQQRFCIRCSEIVDMIGLYCTKCFKENKRYYRNHHVQKLLHTGKCTSCGKIRDREGWVCVSCANKVREHRYKVTQERQEQGLCVRCGKPSHNSTYCQECRNKNTLYMRERRQKLRGS